MSSFINAWGVYFFNIFFPFHLSSKLFEVVRSIVNTLDHKILIDFGKEYKLFKNHKSQPTFLFKFCLLEGEGGLSKNINHLATNIRYLARNQNISPKNLKQFAQNL